MLSVAHVFVLRGLAPVRPVLKGAFVPSIFSELLVRFRCLCGGCQLSGILPCLANLWLRSALETWPVRSMAASTKSLLRVGGQ